MDLSAISESIYSYVSSMAYMELAGLFFGLWTVYLLIRESIGAWPTGVAYVLVSFFVFWEQRLYGDFVLHIVFLVLNIYGWYSWAKVKKDEEEHLNISTSNAKELIIYSLTTMAGIALFGYFLTRLPMIFAGLPEAALPYWDASTSAISITAMWLTARKKIENWFFWLIVNVIATCIYSYKGLYFYTTLYFVYIIMSISGYLHWKKSLRNSAKEEMAPI